jgi:hypothetical protein
LSYRIWNQLAFPIGQPMRNCSSALTLSVTNHVSIPSLQWFLKKDYWKTNNVSNVSWWPFFDESETIPHLSYRIWNQLAFAYGQPMRNCSSALNLSVVCILTRNFTEGSGICLDRMRDFFRLVSIRNTCEYGIIVLPLSVDQSKKMETNAFIKMAQFYNNLIMKRSKQ